MRKVFICMILFIALVAFLPQIASRGWPKRQIESLLEKQLGGTVSVGKLRMSWWGEQVCKNVEWVNSRNGVALRADSVQICSNLYDCFKYKDRALNIFIEGAKMSCPANMRFIKKKKRKNLQMRFSPISALIKDGVVEFERTEINVTESLKVVTWGSVDLEKNTMNLTLGFPPKALEKMFRAKDLPENYLLEIPISTKLSSRALEKQLISFFLKTQLSPYPWQRTNN